MPNNNITLNEIAELLKSNDNYLLLCHKNPDADTLGSALALKTALGQLGKTANICCAHSPSSNTAFLFNEGEDITFCSYENVTVVAVDVASLSLLGTLEEFFGHNITLKIDHHITGEDYAKYNYTDHTCAACGEIIYELIKLLDTDVASVAMPLYAAISSDTGGFRYSNTTSKTHIIAAELLENGADNAYIDHLLFENRTQAQIRAINATYSSMRYYFDGAVAAAVITKEMKDRLNINDDDLGVLNSLTREIEGVVVGITLKQSDTDPTSYKLSVRSEPGFPANELCALFGGGGHPCAAGAQITASSPDLALSSVIKHIARSENKLIPV